MSPDAVVIGGGPAGLSAAVWIARNLLTVTIIDAGEQRNLSAQAVHGYFGLEARSASELIALGTDSLSHYDAVSKMKGMATAIRKTDRGFEITTNEGTIKSRSVVLATGVKDELPDIRGFSDHYGSDVFHCPLCDGYEMRGRDVLVIGWSDEATQFAIDLLRWAGRVTVLTDGHKLQAAPEHRAPLEKEGIEVIEDEVAEMIGARGALEGVRLSSGKRVECDRIFFSLPSHPDSSLAASIGCEIDDGGYVIVDDEGATSVEGVFAAGDITPGTQLVQLAAAEGTLAGLSCVKYLVKQSG